MGFECGDLLVASVRADNLKEILDGGKKLEGRKLRRKNLRQRKLSGKK